MTRNSAFCRGKSSFHHGKLHLVSMANISGREFPVDFFFFVICYFLLRFKNKKINITISCLQPNDTDKKNKKKTSLEYIITIN